MGGARRFFLAVGVPDAGGMFTYLHGVAQDIAQIRAVFVGSLGYTDVPMPENPSAEELRAAVSDWLGRAELRDEDRLVVYYTGHGYQHSSGAHYLCTRGFTEHKVGEGLQASDLAGAVLGRSARPGRLLLILDCCYATQAADAELMKHALEGSACYVLAASSVTVAHDSLFSTHFAESMKSNPASLEQLVSELNERLADLQTVRQLAVGSGGFDFFDGLRPDLVTVLPRRQRPWRHPAARWGLGIGVLAGGAALLAITRPREPSQVPAVVTPRPAATASAPGPVEPAPPGMVRIEGASLRAGIDRDAALSLYTDCVDQEHGSCGSDFQSSVFGRSAVDPHEQRAPSFFIDVHEVTNAQFAAFLNENDQQLQPRRLRRGGILLRDANDVAYAVVGASDQDSYAIRRVDGRYAVSSGHETHPVTFVTLTGADLFCRSAGKRLLHELEWELAARGPEGRAFPWGSDAPKTCADVAFAGNGLRCDRVAHGPVGVGSSPLDRTPQGVMDLGGNVLEWTDTPFVSQEPYCRRSGCFIARGGSFLDRAVWLHAALRSRFRRDSVVNNVGFRCAKDAR